MRRIGSLAALLWVASGVSGILPAQDVEVALADRAPRFLMASPSGGAPLVVDTRSVPSLWRRISVDLNDVTLEQALNTVSRQAGLKLMYSKAVVPLESRVHLQASNITVAGALIELLLDAGVDVLLARDGQLVLVKSVQEGGTVAGRVTDANTGKAVPNASVYLEGTRWRAITGEDGAYRLTDVTAGTYTLTASRIGYAKQSQSVTVAAGQEVTVDLTLRAAATELEQVVVTGTVTPTERKAIPTPISVITADQIEQKGYQRVDQIFRGDIPGAVAWDLGATDYVSEIHVRGASSVCCVDVVKTYIDGVEVANSEWIATIDPSSIDRIEVLRGPEGSTVYGSEALNGVIQIFTKRGALNTPRPQLEAKVSAALIQSPWDNTVQQDHYLAVTGGATDVSYRLGGSWLHRGDWVPGAQTTNASFSGGARWTQGPVTADLSARYYSKSFASAFDPDLLQFGSPYLQPFDWSQTVRQQTYGLNLTYVATPRWKHTLVLGYDRTASESYLNKPQFTTPADSFLSGNSQDRTKASVGYNTTFEGSLGWAVQGSLTAGADHWTSHFDIFLASGVTRTNNAAFSPAVASRSEYTNSGYFVQGQLSFSDALFLTAGLRAEDDQNFGRDFGLAWAPRVGAAYVRMLGDVTAKARVAYGKAIRPPTGGASVAFVTPSSNQLANPNLAPEQQVGFDGGVELYFGGRGSLETSYYHQTAIDLIDYVLIDGSTTPRTYQNQNVGRIRNEGWEFQARLNPGRLSFTGSYSIMISTVQKVSPTYTGDLRPGDQVLDIPKHAGGAALSYSLPRTTATLGMTHIGSWIETDWLALLGVYFGGQPYRGSGRAYWMTYPAFTKFNLSVSQTLTDRVGVFLRFDNLTNKKVFEIFNVNITSGRVTTIGVRVKS